MTTLHLALRQADLLRTLDLTQGPFVILNRFARRQGTQALRTFESTSKEDLSDRANAYAETQKR